MCPWEHELQTDDETGEQFCAVVCLGCGDMDFCREPEHTPKPRPAIDQPAQHGDADGS